MKRALSVFLQYRNALGGIRILRISQAGKLLPHDGISSSNRLINILF